jgi:hypothetical protein
MSCPCPRGQRAHANLRIQSRRRTYKRGAQGCLHSRAPSDLWIAHCLGMLASPWSVFDICWGIMTPKTLSMAVYNAVKVGSGTAHASLPKAHTLLRRHVRDAAVFCVSHSSQQGVGRIVWRSHAPQ